MADLDSGVDKLPPRERLKRAREIEEEKRRLLEEELAKRETELEELKEKTERELDEARELEDESLEEITRESAEAELEERVKGFRGGKEFVPEGGVAGAEGLDGEPAGVTYDSSARIGTGGMGQVSNEQAALYRSEAFERAQENLDYLLNAENPRKSAIEERSRALYQNVRELASGFDPSESYAFNKLADDMYQLKQREEDQRQNTVAHGYMQRITNVLNEVVDYKQEEERRRKAA